MMVGGVFRVLDFTGTLPRRGRLDLPITSFAVPTLRRVEVLELEGRYVASSYWGVADRDLVFLEVDVFFLVKNETLEAFSSFSTRGCFLPCNLISGIVWSLGILDVEWKGLRRAGATCSPFGPHKAWFITVNLHFLYVIPQCVIRVNRRESHKPPSELYKETRAG